MEGLVVILMLIFLYLIFIMKKKVKEVDAKLNHLNNQMRQGNQKILEALKQPIVNKPVEEKAIKSVDKPVESVIEPIVKKEEAPKPISKPVPQAVRPITSVPSKTITPKIKKPKKPSFMERNPDLEKFIGENLLNKIGIVIFVIGMGFLVKLGIDSNVISETMRVVIGILVGGGLIGLGHYMRKSFSKFSSILIGGALAVLYFTIGLAFHEYTLIPQTAAFVIMVIITAFGVLLSIAYDRKSLAVLAMIGGFGTPFFISTGSGNFIVLLTYILLLDIGMLTLVYFKKWNVINYLTYGFTYILFAGVFATKFVGNEAATRGPLFLFLTIYYLIFFLMNIIYNVKNGRKFKFAEIGMLLSNSVIYFGLGLALVHGFKNGLYGGLFTALTAIFNFGFTFLLYKRKDIDKNLLFLLIGLVLTFVSLIAPIQLKGNYITLFWAIEAVLLLWLAKKSEIALMKLASFMISILMLISLLMDWQQNYQPIGAYIVLNLFLNKVFITSIVAAVSLFSLQYLMRDNERIEFKNFQFPWKKSLVQSLFVVFLYLGILLELNYQCIRFDFADTRRFMLLGIYNYTFVIALLVYLKFKPNELLNKVVNGLSLLVILTYLTFYLYQITLARGLHLTSQGQAISGYYWHYVLLLLFVIVTVQLYRDIHKNYGFKSQIGNTSLWILAFITTFISSAEIAHISVIYQFNPQINSYKAYDTIVKSIFPVVWAIMALVLMVVGMKFRLKALRISSLVLFSITIVKLFLYDLQGNTTGKVISFIMLGVILLLISFLYQKLKFIIQDDEKKD